MSAFANIHASIIQGSSLGPASFIITAGDGCDQSMVCINKDTAWSADSNQSCTLYFETLLVVPEAKINANHALITSMTFMF